MLNLTLRRGITPRPFVSLLLLYILMPFGLMPFALQAQGHRAPAQPAGGRQVKSLSRIPLGFESLPSGGSNSFAARGPGYLLALAPEGMSLQAHTAGADNDGAAVSASAEAFSKAKLDGDWNPLSAANVLLRKEQQAQVVEMRLGGASRGARAEPLDRQTARVNYFIGNDPSAWRTNVPLYGKVRYHEVYPAVDVAYYGNPQQLELDFEVRPQGDPASIRMEFPAAARLEMTAAGELQVHTAGSAAPLTLRAPVTYQMIHSEKVMIASEYRKLGSNSIGFTVAGYDPTHTLVIDPVVVFATYLGGNAFDELQALAVDASGNVYVGGYTSSTNFPTVTPISATKKGTSSDAFVAKINASGTTLIYSTYLGGTAFDEIYGISVDASGVVTVAGDTSSADFPLQTPIQPAFGGGGADLFVARINAAGSALTYSTYLGGSGLDLGITSDNVLPMLHVDTAGAAYITAATTSTNFPTVTPLQAGLAGQIDAVVAKLNPAGSTLLFATYVGGASVDFATASTTDAAGNVYITGATNSTDFPTQAAFDSVIGGGTCGSAACPDAFIAKLTAAGTALTYSTYLGGGGEEEAHSIALDSSGNAYVVGYTTSNDFTTLSPLQNTKGAGDDVFVSKLNAAGTALVYSTYIGGGGGDTGMQIRVDGNGRAAITGYTGSTVFPLAGATQGTRGGGLDAFVSLINSAGTGFDFSTFLGGLTHESGTGLAIGPTGDIIVGGWTESANFPVSNPLQAAFGGGTCGTAPNTFPCDDGFIARFSGIGSAPTITSISPTSATVGGAAFTLSVNGTGFTASSLVRVGTLSRPTTFVSSTLLTAAMPATDLATPATLQISVFNGAPDNLASNNVPFTVQAGANAPSVSQGGVVNNASFAPSPAALAPGSIAAIFGQRLTDGSSALSSSFDGNGRLATTLAGARVTVNGTAAPMFYATPGQVGIQVPVELAGQTTASLQVSVGSAQSTPVTVNIAPTAPGIFTVTQDGRGPGAITHADGSLVSEGNPARPGEVIIIYVTGLGPLVPAVATGTRAGASPTLTPATVTFNGIAGAVDYAGSAPGFVGLNQINVRVPEGTLPSSSVQVVVRIGGRDSNTATIAVQ